MASTSKLTLLIDLSEKLFNSKLGQMQKKFGQTVKQMKTEFKEFADEIPGVGRAMDLLSNKWTLIGASLLGIVGGVTKATSMANDWHKQMAEINVTAELSKNELQGLSDKLLDIGTKNVAPLEEVPKAFSRIISAGLDVNQSMEALEPTLRAAKAGFTDIETVASAGIATMMASGEDINKVYDVLFETVKEGKAEFKDIATYMPKIVPLAKNLGYELADAAGAFASLTTKLSAEQSTTSLQGIIRSLSEERIALGQMDKNGNWTSGFKSLGIDVHDATGKIKPLTEIIGLLNSKMEGLTDKQRMQQFGKLGLDQMSTLGFSTLMQNLAGLEKATNATVNSAGMMEKAYLDSLTPLEQWGIAQNNLKATMIKIGEAVLPVLAKAIAFVTPAFEWLYRNIDWIIPIFGTFAAVLGVVTAAMWAWNVALYANPVGVVIAAVAALIALIVVTVKKFDDWGAGMLVLLGPIGWIIIGIKTLAKHWDSIKEAFSNGGIIEGLKRIGVVLLDVLLVPVQQLLTLIAKIPGLGDLAGKGVDMISGLREKLNLSQADKKDPEPDKSNPDGNPFEKTVPTAGYETSGGNSTDLAGQVSKVTGDASQTKNITVNIGTMASNRFEGSTTEGLTWQEVEQRMNDILLRVIRNAELS